MRSRSLLIPLLVLFASACGGSQTPAAAPEAASNGEEPSSASDAEPSEDASGEGEGASESRAIPTECHKAGDVCVPSPKFVKRLCNGRYPSMALYLFGNDSKWTRAYLTRKTEAWNASGGASTGGFLEFDEEVLLLAERKADMGGMQVSGAGAGYDALRWDGSCVTLSGEEVTQKKPPAAKNINVEWRFLDDNVQEALRKDEAINAAYLERRNHCKGAVSGDVSSTCVKADQKLSDAVVRYVRNGGSIPVPTTLPE